MDEKSSKSEGETNGDSSVEGLPRRKWEWTGSHDHRLLNLLETGYKSDLILDLRPEGLRVGLNLFIYCKYVCIIQALINKIKLFAASRT